MGAFSFNDQYETLRTPGYPFFLSIVHRLAGPDQFRLIASLQAVLSALAAVMVFMVSRKWFTERVAWVSAALYIFNPGNWMSVTSILTEPLFGFFLVFVLWLITFYNDRFFSQFLLGLMMGILTLIRPVAGIFWIFYIVCQAVTIKSLRKAVLSILLFSLGILLTEGAWMLRNYCHYQQIYLTEISTYYMYAYLAQDITAMRLGGDFNELNMQAVERFAIARRTNTPPQIMELFDKEAMRVIGAHPRYLFRSYSNGALREITDTALLRWIGRYWPDLPLTATKIKAALQKPLSFGAVTGGVMGLLRVGEIVFLFILFIAAMWNWGKVCCKRSYPTELKPVFLFSGIMLILFFIVSAGPAANFRLREQGIVLWILWGGPLFAKVLDRFKKKENFLSEP